MLEQISYFHIFDSTKILSIEDNVLQVKNVFKPELIQLIAETPYFCILPKEFHLLQNNIFECENLKTSGGYFDVDYDPKAKFASVEQIINQFIFWKLEIDTAQNVHIAHQFDSTKYFETAIKNNSFPIVFNDLRLKQIGITPKFIQQLPRQHNYYDQNLVCPCGESACDSLEVWIIKYDHTFAIPFINSLNNRIFFNLDAISAEYQDWDAEDYIWENVTKRTTYHTFPFCFEYPDFTLKSQNLFKNSSKLHFS